MTQAQLELMGALYTYTSSHPVLVVTDGDDFVVLQPWGETIQYYHASPEIGASVLAANAMRLIAYHLLEICSEDGGFDHLTSVPDNEALSLELAPLLAEKKELGVGEGLVTQSQLDQDLPAHGRLETVSNSILAWREPNLSYFG